MTRIGYETLHDVRSGGSQCRLAPEYLSNSGRAQQPLTRRRERLRDDRDFGLKWGSGVA